jgi:hypothetical protein
MTDEKDDVHWITGQELREIYADDLSLDKYDEIRKRPVPAENRVPSSTELITMANLEWRNREERRGIHNREDWCCGWMAGFLTEKKPNWTKEQIEAAKSSARKEMAKIISEILDREWMCDLNEIKYILDCVANGNSDPFKDRPGKGDDPK